MGVLQIHGKDLGAVSLAVCCMNIYRAWASAHPQFGHRQEVQLGICAICSAHLGQKGTRNHDHAHCTEHLLDPRAYQRSEYNVSSDELEHGEWNIPEAGVQLCYSGWSNRGVSAQGQVHCSAACRERLTCVSHFCVVQIWQHWCYTQLWAAGLLPSPGRAGPGPVQMQTVLVLVLQCLAKCWWCWSQSLYSVQPRLCWCLNWQSSVFHQSSTGGARPGAGLRALE